MQNLQLKVCAMREPDNIKSIYSIRPNFIGFIFNPKSEQYIGNNPNFDAFNAVSKLADKVAVYENENTQQIIDNCKLYGFQHVQLNGSETVEQCNELKNNKFIVIKTFVVNQDFNFSETDKYASAVDYFLFSIKKTENFHKENAWQIIDKYKNEIPFFLSGDIELKDAESIKQIKHPQLFAIDINTKFEIAPAIKDNRLIAMFKHMVSK